jgi:hypothetical protein
MGQTARTIIDCLLYSDQPSRFVSNTGSKRGLGTTNGTYLYRMQAGDFNEVRSMILVK